jgi:ubiquinone/menaquinone biosynthesis C-methylase UbiE
MATTSDDIRAHVAESYSSRIAGILARSAGELPITSAAAACCGDDCCEGDTATAEAPASVAAEACCGDDCCGGSAGDGQALSRIARLYDGSDTSDLPSTVTDVAFGCGNPTAIAALRPGESVLDLGSGGGIDCFLAAKMVGTEGRVFGVDMTPDMVRLARANAAKVGATNVEFRLGEIEHLPIADASIDVVISNCVINLSPEKPAVFAEAFRVLKPGGRLQVSDIVWTKPVPEEVKADMEQWAGCIAGAIEEREYLDHIRAAGFVDVRSDATAYPGREGIASANVLAVKPAL